MLPIKLLVQAAGWILITVAFILPAALWFSRFRIADGFTGTYSAGPDRQIGMLRDLLTVLSLFTPLSLVGLGVILSSTRVQPALTSAAVYGLIAFLVLISDVVLVLTWLLMANFGGRSVPLQLYPISLGTLIAGSGFSVISLAETLA